MRISLLAMVAFVLLAVAPSDVRGVAGELHATVGVNGGEVEVRARLPGGAPAADIQVRLLYAGKHAVAVGRTDRQGRWLTTVERTGPYVAVLEYGPGGAKTFRLPFTVLGTPPEPAVTFRTALVYLACLAWVLALVLFRLAPAARGRLAAVRGALLATGLVLLVWSTCQHWLEPAAPARPADPDVAASARAYLRERKVKPLSEPLARLLADATKRVATQPYALLGQPAPDFELGGTQAPATSLREHIRRGPVVLVFYYGYYCNHCVGQLFALHDDIAKFRELGAAIVAVSADPPELTRTRFRQYGDFAFPVLSDPGNKIARIYGVYKPAEGDRAEDQQHGTFVIGRDGRMHWAHIGYEPFTDNRTLLYELARLEGRLPPARRE